MWPPPNIHALPSKEEIQQVKEEISSMERQIADAQLKIDALRISVAEREAWIAPIRKIPHEVLSHIFLDVSMDNWKAPLTLQSVSRWWRDVVVDTPLAWTFIPLFECDKADQSELISLFVERSRNTTFHIFAKDHEFIPKIKILTHRIECMTLFIPNLSMERFLPTEYDFTRLERLTIKVDWYMDSGRFLTASGWDMMQFPNLKYLDLDVWDALLIAIAASPRFPLIRSLRVVCEDPCPLTDILVKCAKSLESIDLEYSESLPGSPDTTPTIHFPRLRSIQLQDYASIIGPHWYINASTPNLEAYCGGATWPTIDACKLDVGKVSYLNVFSAPDLSRFPRLVNLLIRGRDSEVLEAINCLRTRPQYLPELAGIEHTSYLLIKTVEEAKATLLTYAEETGRRVNLEWTDWKMYDPCGAWLLVCLFPTGKRPV
jgi:F-box-like